MFKNAGTRLQFIQGSCEDINHLYSIIVRLRTLTPENPVGRRVLVNIQYRFPQWEILRWYSV
jgi:hypothetical protein